MSESVAGQGVNGTRKSKKRARKMDEIAASAIETISEMGYANTSLRDIAARSGMSLGMLHYYFDDKVSLIVHCVQLYKRRLSAQIFARLRGSEGVEVKRAVVRILADELEENWRQHCLWYDLRIQALYEPAFRPVVARLEAVMLRLVRSLMQPARAALRTETLYASLDGQFCHFLHRFALGDAPARDEIEGAFGEMLDRLL